MLDAGPDGTDLTKGPNHHVIRKATGTYYAAVAVLTSERAALALAIRGVCVSPGSTGETVHKVIRIARRTASEALRAVLISRLLDVADFAVTGITGTRATYIAAVAISSTNLASACGGRGTAIYHGCPSFHTGQRE